MRRLLAVLAMAGALVVLIVGSLGFLPGRTDAGPVVSTNLACDVNLTVASRATRQTWFINGNDTATVPGPTATDTALILPFHVRNRTTGANGRGIILQNRFNNIYNIQLTEDPVVPSFPTQVFITSTLNVDTLSFSGQAFDNQLNGPLLSGPVTGAIANCEDIDP